MPRDWDTGKERPPRIELPALAGIADAGQRFYLTMYLRGAQESDQETARARCAALGIDYDEAREQARRT